MIVRNESANLPRLFASLRGEVDFYVISDTGSTDDTIEVIRRLGDACGIPGIITRHPWVDFAHNRNLVLQDAADARREGKHDCDWLMIIDADEELAVGDPAWRTTLRKGCSYIVQTRSARTSVARIFLLWTQDAHWHWKGRTHNYPVHEPSSHPVLPLDAVHVVYHEFEGAKSHAFADGMQKTRADIGMLHEELDGQPVDKENAHRYFQLGYGYWNLRELDMAIRYMRMVADFPGAGDGKRYAALVVASKCGILAKLPAAGLLHDLETAISLDEARWEAPFYKAVLLRREGDPQAARDLLLKYRSAGAPRKVSFFREDDIHDWRLDYELAFLCFQTAAYGQAIAVIDGSLTDRKLPALERGFLTALKEKMSGMGPVNPNPASFA